ATGTLNATASVSSDTPDVDNFNNTATVTTHVNPVTADLAVGLTAAPNPALVGGSLTYSIFVTNNGPNSTAGVAVNTILPSSVGIVSVTPSQGTFSIAGNVVVCSFGALANHGQAGATITVIPGAQGIITAMVALACP